MTEDLVEQMMDACKLIDSMLNHSPIYITRHVGDKIEVKYCCTTPFHGLTVEGEFSLDADEAMQSLIDAIHRWVYEPTTERERLIALHKSWLTDAVCQRNEEDIEFHKRRLEELRRDEE